MCKLSYKNFFCGISSPEKEAILFQENWTMRERKHFKKYGSLCLTLDEEVKGILQSVRFYETDNCPDRF